MMKYKVSVVSYQNTIPFVFGLQNHPIRDRIDLSLDHPAACAGKLLNGEADIGLIPVAIQPQVTGGTIISDYCIGSKGAVRSVILYANDPVETIKTIYLDYQSETSVRLARILADRFWKIKVTWIRGGEGYENSTLADREAGVVIGDRAFLIARNYAYVYDLSEAWEAYTGLPFVFATWSTNKKLHPGFEETFNQALKYGLDHMEEAVAALGNSKVLSRQELIVYLTQNIKYILDEAKEEGLARFLSELSSLKT